jgi:hypothetical protein
LVDEAIDQDPLPPPRGLDALIRCGVAVVVPDAYISRQGHPPYSAARSAHARAS